MIRSKIRKCTEKPSKTVFNDMNQTQPKSNRIKTNQFKLK